MVQAQPTAPIHKEDTESFLRSIGYWSARTCYIEVTNELENTDNILLNRIYYTRLRNQRYYFRAKMREIADAHRCIICHRWFGTHWLRPVQGPHMHGTANVTKQRVCVHCIDPKRPSYDKIFKTYQRIEDRLAHWRRLAAPLGSPEHYTARRYAGYCKASQRLYMLLLRTPRIIHEWTFDDDILNRRGGN